MEPITSIQMQEVDVSGLNQNLRMSETGNFNFIDYFLGLQTVDFGTFQSDKAPNIENQDKKPDELVEALVPNLIFQTQVEPTDFNKKSSDINAKALINEFIEEPISINSLNPISKNTTESKVLKEGEKVDFEPIVEIESMKLSMTPEKVETTNQLTDLKSKLEKVEKPIPVKPEVKNTEVNLEKKELDFNKLEFEEEIKLDESHKLKEKVASTVFDSKAWSLQNPGKVENAHSPITKSRVELPINVSEVTSKVTSLINRSGGKMTLSLNPPELGKVEVDVKTHGKEVEIILKPESSHTKAVLNEHIDELRSAISSQNLTLSRLEINVTNELSSNFSSLNPIRHDNSFFMLNPDSHNGYGQEKFYGRNEHSFHFNSKMNFSESVADFSHNGRVNISV